MVPSVMLGVSWMTSGVPSGSSILTPNDSGISTATESIIVSSAHPFCIRPGTMSYGLNTAIESRSTKSSSAAG